VLSGDIVACKWVRLACERHCRDLIEGSERGLFFDPDAAEHAIDFFGLLRHSKGEWAGQRFKLTDWQEFVTWCLFGWMREDEDGGDPIRRFNTAYLEAARKNGKTTWLAGFGLYLFAPFGDGEPGAEVYCLDPSVRVLTGDLRWRPIGELNVGDRVVGFDEEPSGFRCQRKLRPATIVNASRIKLPSYRIRLNDGREIIASENHLWLCRGKGTRGSTNQRWVKSCRLQPGAKIRSFGKPWTTDESRDAGYLAGIYDGEGNFHGRCARSGFRIGFGQKPGPVMDRVRALMADRGFNISPISIHKSGTAYFQIGGAYECFRFLGQIRPERLLRNVSEWYSGRAPNRGGGWPEVTSVEFLGRREVVAIETTSHTLFAEGLFSHNTAATKRDQARISHSEATRMVRSSPGLSKRIGIFKDNLHVEATASKFEPLGADADSMDGLNIHGALVDELHAHKKRDTWEVLETATGARRQPLQIAITTAGFDRQSICYEQRRYTERVLDGVVEDDTHFGIIYTIDEEDDWRDEGVWIKANPNLGVSVKLRDLRRKARQAAEMPAKQNSFKRKHLDIWTQQSSRWIDLELWKRNYHGPVIAEAMHGRRCFGGLDLASVSDLAAWVMVFPDEDEPDYIDVLCRFWCPEARLTAKDNPYADHYRVWADEGWLTTTPGNAIDYGAVKAQVLADAQVYAIESVNIDRLYQGYQLAMELADEELEVVGMGMGFYSMAAPMRELEARLLARKVNHGNNPVLTWMADNLAVKEDPAGNLKPDKASSEGKIDGIVSLVMAIDRAMRRCESPVSPYETEDITFIEL